MFELYPGYNATPMTELAMQLPNHRYGNAFAFDWNNDGWLDLWHANHFVFSRAEDRWSDASTTRIEVPIFPSCTVDWDAVLQDGSNGTYYAPNDGNGFIEWADAAYEKCFDVHSSAFLDIDGDGFKDLFLLTGGGKGVGDAFWVDNLLFWGTPTNSSLGYRLVGGRDAARAAGLNGRNEIGRHQHWFDMDGDGLLDVVFLNIERLDNLVVPSKLHHNLGGRRFQVVQPQENGFEEFSSRALLTDVDGDGFARELIVPSECNSRRGVDSHVCDKSPRGSISIYGFHSSPASLVRESLTPKKRDHFRIRSFGTGDFDFDGIADVAFLWGTKVNFHLSSARKKRCQRFSDEKERRTCLLSLAKPDVVLKLKNCDLANGIRFADFNLDGRIDMLVVCTYPGGHGVYELRAPGKWREMRNPNGRTMDFGEINSPWLMMGGKDFCKGVPVTNEELGSNPRCRQFFNRKECSTLRYPMQFDICSERAQATAPNSGVLALGATVADIDNDGFADVILEYNLGTTVMFRNALGDIGRKRRYIAVRLDRTAGEAASIGAIVTLKTVGMGRYNNETWTQMRVVSSLSHESDTFGSHEDRLVFGLGARGGVRLLTIQWPHCCNKMVIRSKFKKFWKWYNSMSKPFEIPPPKICDDSCF